MLQLKNNFDIIGISALYEMNYDIVLETAKIIKKYNKNIPVVIGGIAANTLDKLPDNIDVIVKGEGEKGFLDFVLDYKINEIEKRKYFKIRKNRKNRKSR